MVKLTGRLDCGHGKLDLCKLGFRINEEKRMLDILWTILVPDSHAHRSGQNGVLTLALPMTRI